VQVTLTPEKVSLYIDGKLETEKDTEPELRSGAAANTHEVWSHQPISYKMIHPCPVPSQ
jgi:hypothetical protein